LVAPMARCVPSRSMAQKVCFFIVYPLSNGLSGHAPLAHALIITQRQDG
jgi:hypothetical protein